MAHRCVTKTLIGKLGGSMIDLQFLRENPDVVKENIKKKFL